MAYTDRRRNNYSNWRTSRWYSFSANFCSTIMAIAYSPIAIVISDDYNPSRQPLVLPATATSAEVEEAVANYISVFRPSVTALEHLESVGLGSDYQPTLIYLRINLTAANKTCAELDALEAYLQGVLAVFAQDQSPRNDWPMPPVTFDAAVIAAMSELS